MAYVNVGLYTDFPGILLRVDDMYCQVQNSQKGKNA